MKDATFCLLLVFLVGVSVASSAGRHRKFSNSLPVEQMPKQECDPTAMIQRHEGFQRCMYLDTMGIKTIGWGYNLERSQARREVGADFDKIMNGPSSKANVPCNCSAVPCLGASKIEDLFQDDLALAVKGAHKDIPGLASYCCNVYNRLVDMAFNMGTRKLSTLTQFLAFIEARNWKAAADDLLKTKYCNGAGEPINRCRETAEAIRHGCP